MGIRWIVQAAGSEGFDCKTIIGILAMVIAGMAAFIVKQFLARIKDLKDANSLATTLLHEVDHETRKKGGH